jgi:dihydroxyacid dehydratase/phosphogluconate dehydratase
VSGPIRPLSVKKEGKKEKKEKHEQMKAVQAGCSEKISLAQLSKVEQEALQQTGFPK